jgi:hypothetical protein
MVLRFPGTLRNPSGWFASRRGTKLCAAIVRCPRTLLSLSCGPQRNRLCAMMGTSWMPRSSRSDGKFGLRAVGRGSPRGCDFHRVRARAGHAPPLQGRGAIVGLEETGDVFAHRVFVDSEEAGDVFAHFVLPVGPVVAALGAPVVQRVADAFAGQDLGEAVGGGGFFPLACAGYQMDVAGG